MIRKIERRVFLIRNAYAPDIFVEASSEAELAAFVANYAKEGHIITSVVEIQRDGTTPRVAVRSMPEYKNAFKKNRKLIVFDKETYSRQCQYWSNACGDLFIPNNSKTITEEELPYGLHEAFTKLWREDEFGLNCYLVEYNGAFGIALHAEYNDRFAADLGITRTQLDKLAEKTATKLAKELNVQVMYGKSIQEWSDGELDTVVIAFIPWDTERSEYEKIGSVFSQTVYDKDIFHG